MTKKVLQCRTHWAPLYIRFGHGDVWSRAISIVSWKILTL